MKSRAILFFYPIQLVTQKLMYARVTRLQVTFVLGKRRYKIFARPLREIQITFYGKLL